MSYFAVQPVAGSPAEGDVRLVGSSGQGRVEVYYLKRWGTVCNCGNTFSLVNAIVVCRQLGYTNASGWEFAVNQFGRGSGFVWLHSLSCTGYETNILQCHGGSPGVPAYCCSDHSRDVAVSCTSKYSKYGMHTCTHTHMHAHTCTHTHTFAHAHTQCYADKHTHTSTSKHKTCTYVHYCNSSKSLLRTYLENVQDIAGSGKEGSIRLAGGSVPSEGRVEVFLLGQWGRVCGSTWDQRDATVACHQLGYSTALNVDNRLKFGQGNGLTWLNNLQCTGYEANLTQCVNGDQLAIALSWCYGDAGVTCTGVTNRALTILLLNPQLVITLKCTSTLLYRFC